MEYCISVGTILVQAWLVLASIAYMAINLDRADRCRGQKTIAFEAAKFAAKVVGAFVAFILVIVLALCGREWLGTDRQSTYVDDGWGDGNADNRD